MKTKLLRSYKSKNGNTVFVYTVTGTPAQMEAYKAAQGDQFRETEEGVALWFTTRCIGNAGTLIITVKGKIVPDMSAFEQAASLAKQYGGNFGQELARMAAMQLVGGHPEAQVAQGTVAKEPMDKF
jgi:hypothetical protein